MQLDPRSKLGIFERFSINMATLMAMTSAFIEPNWVRPAVMSHNSWVQTLVKARGKKRRTVFFWPKLALSLTSTRLPEVLDLSVKSGAWVPTAIGMVC